MKTLLVAAIASAVIVAQTPAADTSAKAVVAAATEYVEGYSTKMQNVLADELAVQRASRDDALHETPRTTSRTTKADMFITFLPAESVWIAARDVREVDGTVVDDPDNIRALMERTPLSRLGAVIAKKNSQFNIGNISRTFNEPTLALLVMSRKHKNRFEFERTAVSQGATPRVTISYKEKSRPTLISTNTGAPVYTYGDLLVDAATGRVEHTRLELKLGSVRAKIETVYGDNQKLKLWVPVSMNETYEQTARDAKETITCESTYTNYRKFETSVIIK